MHSVYISKPNIPKFMHSVLQDLQHGVKTRARSKKENANEYDDENLSGNIDSMKMYDENTRRQSFGKGTCVKNIILPRGYECTS